ncbi:MAG: polar localization protein TipN, partial [Caulobacteraceae bacterium]
MAKKRPTLDFTRIAPEGIVPRFEPAPDQRLDAPPVLSADLEIVDAPAVEMGPGPSPSSTHGTAWLRSTARHSFSSQPTPEAAAPESALTPPTPEQLPRPTAEPPLPPAVLQRAPRLKESGGGLVWAVACVVSAVWAAAPIAYAFGYRQNVAPLQNDPMAMTVFALLAVGPLALIWIAAYLMRQGQKLTGEIRRTRDLAQTMVGPAALAAAEAGTAVEAIRYQIEAASASASEARETMLALRQALAEETERLAAAAASAERTSRDLAETLGRQRDALGALSGELDARSAAVADSISMQARMVAEASDLAETQLREAEATLTARAADLAAAAGEASDAARVAGEDLARQVARLETAGVGVGDQMRLVEAGLSQQRASLVTVSHAIRADQEDFAAQAETRAAQLSEFMAQATMSASDLGDTAARGGEALRNLIGEAAAQMTALLETAASEREALAGESQNALNLLSDAAAGERVSMERDLRESIDRLTQAAVEARLAAEGHAGAAQARVDQLSEAAFAAHQKADAIFQSRLDEARDLIESSAQMVEQAGAQTAAKLEQGAASAKATLAELQALLADLEARTQSLPQQARAQTEEVKAAVDKGMADLMESARHTAEETQAIDSAFQERVRRNYDMLTDAVKLMGVVAGAAATPTPAPVTPPPASLRSREISGEAVSREAGLRPRLRLTPTATDEEFRSVFEAAGGRAPPEAAPEGD